MCTPVLAALYCHTPLLLYANHIYKDTAVLTPRADLVVTKKSLPVRQSSFSPYEQLAMQNTARLVLQ